MLLSTTTPGDAWDTARSVLSLLGPAIGLPGLIALLLGRRQANKKLNLDEKTTDVTEFQALNEVSASLVAQARQAMLDARDAAKAAQADAAAAKQEASRYKSEREDLKSEVDSLVDSVRKLRDLLKSYMTRTGVPLTTDEQRILDVTIDPHPMRRGRKR